MMNALVFSPAVAAAMDAGKPIVALESTIITHGMPYPQNYETAAEVEQVVRDNGGEPATIAVMDGKIHIGLSDTELQTLAQTPDAMKLSRGDLAACLAMGRTGATTVAATMICAELGGIRVFATGGIGGVHRGAEHSFDISADLAEFSLSNVTVVAAGAKAILDIPKTLEVLETNGVPVITYGANEFPAFWSRKSGLPSPLRMDTAAQIAASHNTRETLGLRGGQLVGNPILEVDEISADYLNPIIQTALGNADKKGIAAKSVTPFLLSEIFKLTDGKSLVANIALVKNNAKLATQIATELCKLG